MKERIKDFLRGFVGGPDFSGSIKHRFILENKELTINIPNSNIAVLPSKVDISFPHTSTTWFKQHVEESYDQHLYVHMLTKNWMYVPVVSILPSSEYGMLTCQLRIKQTDKINVLNKQALAEFVIKEYDNYHNGPDGQNTKLRKQVTQRFNKSSVIRTLEELKEDTEQEIAEYIELHGYQKLPQPKIQEFNNREWIFYQEVRNNRLSRHDYYCFPLSSTSFLEIKFNHNVDRSDKHKKWKKHALASQERIMASITLADIPVEQDNLLAEHNVKASS